MGYKVGLRVADIANRINRSPTAVRRLIQRWEEDGTLDTKSRPGRPRGTLPGDDRFMKIRSLQDRRATAHDIRHQITGVDGTPKVSVWTIRRRLRDFGLFARRPRRKPLLTKANKVYRLAWARAHVNWTIEDWKKVLWTDESS